MSDMRDCAVERTLEERAMKDPKFKPRCARDRVMKWEFHASDGLLKNVTMEFYDDYSRFIEVKCQGHEVFMANPKRGVFTHEVRDYTEEPENISGSIRIQHHLVNSDTGNRVASIDMQWCDWHPSSTSLVETGRLWEKTAELYVKDLDDKAFPDCWLERLKTCGFKPTDCKLWRGITQKLDGTDFVFMCSVLLCVSSYRSFIMIDIQSILQPCYEYREWIKDRKDKFQDILDEKNNNRKRWERDDDYDKSDSDTTAKDEKKNVDQDSCNPSPSKRAHVD